MIKVLIVEDDYMLALINRKNVELLGYTVVAAVTNGEAAIEAVKKHTPDVVLMDLRLEGDKDGIDIMMEIGKFSTVPVIYLTGSSDTVNKSRASQTNTLAFCIKPVHFEELDALFKKIKP